MVMTITKIGDSQGIIFDTVLLELAHLKLGDQIKIVVDNDGTITITPFRSEVSKVIDATIEDFTETLKKLA